MSPSRPTLTVLLDDFTRADLRSTLGPAWTAISDRVMGGVSDVDASMQADDRGRYLALRGQVREVPGYGSPGFVQAGLDLGGLDASGWSGVRLVVRGDGQACGLHLRTPDVRRPWQSYRGRFPTTASWNQVRVPFDALVPHRIDAPFDPTSLSRLSLIAVDRTGPAHLDVREVALYR